MRTEKELNNLVESVSDINDLDLSEEEVLKVTMDVMTNPQKAIAFITKYGHILKKRGNSDEEIINKDLSCTY